MSLICFSCGKVELCNLIWRIKLEYKHFIEFALGGNMDKEKEQILREIYEHTIDCDYNRCNQFKAYSKYSKKYRTWQKRQNISLLLLISYYMFSYSFPEIVLNFKFIEVFPLVFSVFAVFSELWCLFGDYSGLSNRCWISAQAYSRLYRKCQFFYNHNELNDIELLKLKAKDLVEQLNEYNLFSPHIDEDIYKKTKEELKNKSYPIEEIINNSTFPLKLS